MTDNIKPAMAYPAFASATYTFAPAKWPLLKEGGFTFKRYEASAVTAGGKFIRQSSPIVEKILTLAYRLMSTTDRDAFAAPGGAGFFYLVAGEKFEYKHTDGTIYQARFLSSVVMSTPQGNGRWSLGPVRMLIEN